MSISLDTVPGISSLILEISRRNPRHGKSLHLPDSGRLEAAEKLTMRLFLLAGACGITADQVVEAYLTLVRDTFSEEIKFQRTGRYSLDCASQARETVYINPAVMTSYMFGLGLSQVFWPNHLALHEFLRTVSRSLRPTRYLEIGPGHGLHLLEAMETFPEADFTVLDLSPVSLDLTRRAVALFQPETPCRFLLESIENYHGEAFDYVVMGEVLEHVDDPLLVLRQVRSLLTPQGRLYVTTCANCPAIDHIYQYRNLTHIRRHIAEADLAIEEELALPVRPAGDFAPEDEISLNYGAILSLC